MSRSDAASAWQHLVLEFGRFGTVGAVNFALDLALFNALLFSVLEHLPIAAKAVSGTVAATSSYFMNRHWTWRHRTRRGTRRELSIFLAMSVIALGITECCLLVSHYGLGLTSKLEDNVSANVLGLALATTWRFWSFRKWVFLSAVGDPARDEPTSPTRASPTTVA